jgi:hypothetical protein
MPCRLSGRARQCIELTDRFRKLVAYVQELLRSHNLLAFDRSLHRRERITWHLSDNLGDVVCNFSPCNFISEDSPLEIAQSGFEGWPAH